MTSPQVLHVSRHTTCVKKSICCILSPCQQIDTDSLTQFCSKPYFITITMQYTVCSLTYFGKHHFGNPNLISDTSPALIVLDCRGNQWDHPVLCISTSHHSQVQLAGAVCGVWLPGSAVVHVLDSPGQGGASCQAEPVPPWGGHQRGGGCALGEVCALHCCLGNLCSAVHSGSACTHSSPLYCQLQHAFCCLCLLLCKFATHFHKAGVLCNLLSIFVSA